MVTAMAAIYTCMHLFAWRGCTIHPSREMNPSGASMDCRITSVYNTFPTVVSTFFRPLYIVQIVDMIFNKIIIVISCCKENNSGIPNETQTM